VQTHIPADSCSYNPSALRFWRLKRLKIVSTSRKGGRDGYGLDWTTGKNRRFSFLQTPRQALGIALPLIQWVPLIPSRRVKRPGRKANLSLPCNALRAVATAIGSHNYEIDVQRLQEGSGLILMLCDSFVCRRAVWQQCTNVWEKLDVSYSTLRHFILRHSSTLIKNATCVCDTMMNLDQTARCYISEVSNGHSYRLGTPKFTYTMQIGFFISVLAIL